MIAVEARGRMGNQMFQVAFAHAASRRLGTSFVVRGPSDLWHGFELGPWSRRSVRAARIVAFRLRHGGRPEYVEVDEATPPGDVLSSLRDGVTYRGYFQSGGYFAGYEDEIRSLFAVRGEHQAAFEERYGGLGPYVCLHMRRGDFLEWHGGRRVLPASYYMDALEAIPDRDRLEVIVISDDLDAARRELGGVPEVRFESNPAMVDLLLLTRAQVVVSSNSSFSWWGAWLNDRPRGQVLVPKHWFGFADGVDDPPFAISDRWTTITVRDRPAGVTPSTGRA